MSASLRRQHSPRTVLLRMAADQERAERIRALKDERPTLTWHAISEHVGVKERSAIEWQSTGGISPENAVKLAELFEVDFDWLYRGVGEGPATPTPFSGRDDVLDRLDRMEQAISEIHRLARDTNRALRQQHEDGEDIQAALERLERAAAQELGDEQPPRQAAG